MIQSSGPGFSSVGALSLYAAVRGAPHLPGINESADVTGPGHEDDHQHIGRPEGGRVQHSGFNGGEGDAFVGRLHASGRSHGDAHLVGGVGFETAPGVGVDAQGRAHVVGFTDSEGAALLRDVQGGYGGAADRGRAIAVLPHGEARITGESASNDFLSGDAWQDHLAGVARFGRIAFVTVLSVPTRPPEPTGMPATLRVRAAIRLQWEDQSDDETAFEVKRSPAGSPSETVLATGPNVNFRDDPAVEIERHSTYHLHAVKAAGRSEPLDPSQAGITTGAQLTLSAGRIDFGGARQGTTRARTVRLRDKRRGPVDARLDGPYLPCAPRGRAETILSARGARR